MRLNGQRAPASAIEIAVFDLVALEVE